MVKLYTLETALLEYGDRSLTPLRWHQLIQQNPGLAGYGQWQFDARRSSQGPESTGLCNLVLDVKEMTTELVRLRSEASASEGVRSLGTPASSGEVPVARDRVRNIPHRELRGVPEVEKGA